jgi:hypothetical protein
MNIPHMLKTGKLLPLMVAGLLLVASCDKGEDDSLNPVLFSIDIPEGLITSQSDLYLVASDAEGETLAFTQLQDGQVNELRSDTYKESSFTLSIISKYTAGQFKDLYGSSYHGVKRGQSLVIDGSAIEESENYINFTTGNFDVTNAASYAMASNGDTDYVYPDDLGGILYMAKSPTRVFITKYNKNFVATGFLFPSTTYTASQEPIISLSGTYTPFQTETVTFSESVFAGVEVYGLPSATSYDEQYQVADVSTDGTRLDIKYPGTAFPAYASYSYIEGDGYYLEAYHKSQRSDFSPMDVDATIEINGQEVTYSVTGDGDIVSLDFDQEGTDFEYIDWDMYANTGTNQSLVLPKLPIEITSGFSSYSYSNWQAEDELVVLQIEGISSTDEYLAGDIGGGLENSRNTKYLYLYLGVGPARSARAAQVSEKANRINLANFKSRFEKNRRVN